MRTDGEVIIGTKLDTTGVDEGIEKIKSEHSDENIELVSEDNNKILSKMLTSSKRIARSFLGISATTFRFLGGIIKVVAKLGIIGAILGTVVLVGYGIAKAFQEAVKGDQELQTKLEYLKFSMKSAFENIGGALVNVFKWLIDRLMDIMAVLGAIIKLITGFNIFSKATADNFKKANKSASGLKKTLAGFDEVNVLNENGQTGLIGGLVGDISQLDDLSKRVEDLGIKIKRFLIGDYDNLGEALTEELKSVPQNLINILKPIYSYVLKPYVFKPFKQIVKELKPIWDPIKTSFENTIKNLKEMWNPFVEYITPNVINPLEDRFNNLTNDLKNTFAPFFNTIISWINKAFGVFGVKLDYIETESDKVTQGLQENMVGALQDVKSQAEKTFNPQYKINIDTKNLNTSKTWIEDIGSKLKELVSKTWNIKTRISNTTPALQGAVSGALGMASGGIINLPGSGVPIGNVVGGESGAEGIIPLTDQQAMETLGQAIGKYITVNANITNEMNGRVISKELKKINAEDNFAFNR